MLYLLFVVVAFVFWVFLSLDTEVQRDFDVPLEIQDLPDSVVLIGDVPSAIQVSVKGKDSQLLKFTWGKMSPLRFRWADKERKGKLYVTRTELDGMLRDYFGSAVRIVSFKPDSIKLQYSAHAPQRVPLSVITDVSAAPQYTISGPIRANVETVKAYMAGKSPTHLTIAETETLVATSLKDTMQFQVKIRPIRGIKFVPDRVTVTVPVEPLIARTRQVSVEPVNVPEGEMVATFPSKVDVSYLVPMSQYASSAPIRACADYSGSHSSGKLYVFLSDVPKIYQDVKVTPDSVDFIIEKL